MIRKDSLTMQNLPDGIRLCVLSGSTPQRPTLPFSCCLSNNLVCLLIAESVDISYTSNSVVYTKLCLGSTVARKSDALEEGQQAVRSFEGLQGIRAAAELL